MKLFGSNTVNKTLQTFLIRWDQLRRIRMIMNLAWFSYNLVGFQISEMILIDRRHRIPMNYDEMRHMKTSLKNLSHY